MSTSRSVDPSPTVTPTGRRPVGRILVGRRDETVGVEMGRRGGPPSTLRGSDRPITVVHGGRVDYRTAWAWQRHLVDRRTAGTIGDVLLVVEHPATYTLGSRADPANVLLDRAGLARAGIDLVRVDRGGDVTYHGPGQVVGYPILQLSGPRVVDYVRALEEVNLHVLAHHGITAHRVDGLTGVWTPAGKVTAIGVRVSAGRVTQHGWATNVTTDLDDFGGIVPCGLDRPVTSMAALGATVGVDQVAQDSVEAFLAHFDTTGSTATPGQLGLLDVHADPTAIVPSATA